MYFPILRGKRFELLALRQTAAALAASGQFTPIVEPVRERTLATDLRRAADALSESAVPFAVVVNPTVGELSKSGGTQAILDELDSWPTAVKAQVRLAYACTEGGNQSAAVQHVLDRQALKGLPSIVLCLEDFEVQRLGVDKGQLVIETIAAPRARTARRLGAGLSPSPGIVEIDDPFPAQVRNADYVTRGESVFTDQNVYFSDEGLSGFADYLTIGREFRDGGGSPNYVAVHWTYTKPTPRDGGFPIYLQHFCSSDAERDYDVAAKFEAAVAALFKFLDGESIATNPATEELRSYFEAGKFPGLGVLKKISIANHLYVMANVL